MAIREGALRFARGTTVALLIATSVLTACHPDGKGKRPKQRDPHVVQDGKGLEPRRDVISPVTVRAPIYACATTVVVFGYIPHAKVTVLVNGTAVASGSSASTSGLTITVPTAFVANDKVTAEQEFDGTTSTPSNQVTVTSHTEDYPAGLPQPHLIVPPLLACGRAVGVADVVPGAWVRVFAENPAAGGGFDPPVQLGETHDFSYIINSPFVEQARIHAESGLCTDRSPDSPVETVQAAPGSLPKPSLDPVAEQAEIVVVRGPSPDGLGHGATLDVFSDKQPAPGRIGGQPTMGGPAGQQVGVSPPAPSPANFTATQSLCATTSPPSDVVPVTPCSQLGAPIIRPPVPGDTAIQVISAEPGARILVYANGVEIGDGGGASVNLVRPVAQGDVIKVLQQVGDCRGSWVYQITVDCATGGDASGCTADWPTFRQNARRSAQQAQPSVLSDPFAVKRLAVRWKFTPPTAAMFRASPIVFQNRVFIGDGLGHIYALDAATGHLLWTYPASGQPALTSSFQCNDSSFGIASSAAIAHSAERKRDLLIFAAPDRSIGRREGSGRLFALDPATGAEIWKSPEVAVLNTAGSNPLHEQIGYSAPLVLNNRVYVGIADHCDNPIQNGRVAAVNVDTGSLISTFAFSATGSRGGGVWSALAGGLERNDIYATTGNSNTNCFVSSSPPSPNHGLSFLRLDGGSGSLTWKFQPVPYDLDCDPDWSAGASLADTSCGPVALSTQKDGWSYALNTNSSTAPNASVRWQFPATGFPFTAADHTSHGDTRYLIPGANWNQNFIVTTGGEATVTSLNSGFNRIHSLNVCGGGGRVRWVANVPGTSASPYQLGPPTVTHGIVFVGTARGHLVAIADPAVWSLATHRCSNPDVAVADCTANGFYLVPDTKVLLDLDLDPASASDEIKTEPALAGGRVFVATGRSGNSQPGAVYMVDPH
jgi:outer membrane protein assembly factor BamB